MKPRALLNWIIAGVLHVCVFCTTSSPTSAGNGSETTNTASIRGRAISVDGTPVATGVARLRPIDYVARLSYNTSRLPSRYHRDTPIADGAFRFDSIASGEYVIELADGIGNAEASVCVLNASDMRELQIPDRTLRAAASIAGTVTAQGGGASFVTLIGLEKTAPVDSVTGRYLLDTVAPGTYSLRVVPVSTQNAPRQIELPRLDDSARLDVGVIELPSFAQEDLSVWTHTAEVRIATQNPSAYDSVVLTGFPLLVRLNQDNFDFSQARTDGADIRFGARNAPVRFRYEIEQWNSTARTASIWVLLDTLRPSDTESVFIMLWGNQSAPDFSSGAAVFDSALGYAGVWHMKRTGDLYPDATANGNDGLGSRYDSLPVGVAGSCERFDGVSDRIVCPPSRSLDIEGPMTLAAWVWLDDIATERYYRVLSKKTAPNLGDGYEMECNPGLRSATPGDYGSLTLLTNGTSFARGWKPWSDGWHYCVTVMSGTDQGRTYLDGIDITGDPWVELARRTAAPLIIGAGAWGDYVKGAIDEVRVMSRATDAAWVAISYENQRPGSTMVRVGP